MSPSWTRRGEKSCGTGARNSCRRRRSRSQPQPGACGLALDCPGHPRCYPGRPGPQLPIIALRDMAAARSASSLSCCPGSVRTSRSSGRPGWLCSRRAGWRGGLQMGMGAGAGTFRTSGIGCRQFGEVVCGSGSSAMPVAGPCPASQRGLIVRPLALAVSYSDSRRSSATSESAMSRRILGANSQWGPESALCLNPLDHPGHVPQRLALRSGRRQLCPGAQGIRSRWRAGRAASGPECCHSYRPCVEVCDLDATKARRRRASPEGAVGVESLMPGPGTKVLPAPGGAGQPVRGRGLW